ncbi:MAG: hypothetical protein BGO88_04725 [Flavobacterium sp. 38-13]|uniref:DUF2528 family protein n=1 Tax=Flavobacterium sp. 38-13 TaxID=1896168 RepID=UPI000960F376|nr:DUF2528 family protein [Flavobacterium sp. 38-13]OJX55521.1 MAG: hypothetical protein BGO88_04725 [Flavobacterium sp. 38-13]
MKNIQRYTIEHLPTSAGLTVEINFDFISKEKFSMMDMIKTMVDFFSDADSRLRNNKNYLEAFLKQLTEMSILLSIEHNCNINGVIRQFEKQEGYCRMDGTMGIKLIELCMLELDDQDDYEITKHDYVEGYYSPTLN